jgi:hypothetical protein
VLEHLIQQRDQTYEELASEFNKHDRNATISARHLGRLARGERDAVRTTPATRRALRAMFGLPVDELLRPWQPASEPNASDQADGNPLAPTTTAVEVTAIIDGRLVPVALDRRELLRAMLVVGGANMLTGPVAQSVPRRASVDPLVVEHFAKLRNVLVDSDSLLGPGHLMPTIHHQISMIEELREQTRGDLYTQLLATQAKWAEFAGWLSDDAGDLTMGIWWTDRAMELSQEAADVDLTAYVLARKAQQAWSRSRHNRRGIAQIIGLAEAAVRNKNASPSILAFGRILEAHGHALLGDATASQRALGLAEELVAVPYDGPLTSEGGRLGGFCTPVYLRVQEANCWLSLDKPGRAVDAFNLALTAWPAAQERERGLHLAQLSFAYAAAGQPDEAIAAGLQAVYVASATQSARIAFELDAMTKRLGSAGGTERAALDAAIRSLTEPMRA